MAANSRSASRPVGALVSQGIVAAASLGLQLIAFSQLGAGGLGAFSLLFGILITVNSIQSGWIGDSLTVLDRFEPGYRRALIHSQVLVVGLTFVVTTVVALPVGGVDLNTAVLFGFASTAWVVEETMRRLLIARREFWKLAANDAAFAVGSFSLVGFTMLTDNQFTLETLVLALFAGAVVAIGFGFAQLPHVELSRGLLGPSRMNELASFAFWRAAQIGLRPGSQAIVRFIVVAAVSVEALGELEAARLLLAPILTAVNGAGVYLLPTYSSQIREGRRFRPGVPTAMLVVGGVAASYGLLAVVLRAPLTSLLPGDATAITATALIAWTAYSVGFGAGVPAGNAMVALSRSREAFFVRCIDAAVGIIAASLLAVIGWVDGVPFGLAAGTGVGAALLLRRLSDGNGNGNGNGSHDRTGSLPPPALGSRSDDGNLPVLLETDVLRAAVEEPTWVWQPAEVRAERPPLVSVPHGRPVALAAPDQRSRRKATRQRVPTTASTPVAVTRQTMQQRLLWLLPLVMIVATEYKVRRRSIDEALTGAVDPLIAVELAVYGLIGAWALWRLAVLRPKFTPLLIAMWGYILTTSVSALYSTFPMLGMARAVQFVIIGAVIHLVAAQGTVDTMVRLAHGWTVLMTGSILVGLAYVAPTTGPQVGRFTWLSVHSVSAGSMLAISLCVLMGLWLQSGRRLPDGRHLRWNRNVYALLFAIQFVFLLLTRTRGSIGGAFIALAIMAWVWSGNKMKPQLLLGSIVAGAGLVLAFGGPIIQFLTRGESAESIGTFNRRTEIWTLAWESFLTRPLHGLGFSSAKGVFFDETGLGGAHNAFVNVMIDTGLAGLIWWCLLLGASMVVLNRQWSHRRVSPTHSGAAGTARADHLIIMGIYVASLINSVTTEGLGAGVNVSVIWWLVTVAWLTILERPDGRPPANDEPTTTAIALTR